MTALFSCQVNISNHARAGATSSSVFLHRWGFRHILGKLPTKTTYYFHYQYITSQKIEFRQNPILEHFLKHRPINRILPES